MLNRKILAFCLALLFISALVIPVSANKMDAPPPSTSTKLWGLNWSAKTDPISCTLDGSGPTYRVYVHNDKESSEKMAYAVYNVKDPSKPVLQGDVKPGATTIDQFTITEPGEYYLSLGCIIPPGMHYFLPPCKGRGEIFP